MAKNEPLHTGFHIRVHEYLNVKYPDPGVDADEFWLRGTELCPLPNGRYWREILQSVRLDRSKNVLSDNPSGPFALLMSMEKSNKLTASKETCATNGIHMREAATIFLLSSFLFLCSCANFRLPPEEPTDNRPRIPGSGDIGE
jgi:hypothetical protein